MGLPGKLAVWWDVTCSSTLCTDSCVCDAARLCALPWAQDPERIRKKKEKKKKLHMSIKCIYNIYSPVALRKGSINRCAVSHLLSSSLRVPLSRASSLSCIFLRSFWSSGVSMPCLRILRICGPKEITYNQAIEWLLIAMHFHSTDF